MGTGIKLALVDDDPAFLFDFSSRLQALDLIVRGFREATVLLRMLERGAAFDCIVADVRMPGMSGVELQQRLIEQDKRIPLILITGYADVEVAVSAVKAGATDFLIKPLDEGRVKACVEKATEEARLRQNDHFDHAAIASRVAELNERHRQVLGLMVQGMTSKQIAQTLGINHRTVENYRALVMDKVGVSNVAQLVRAIMQIESGRPRRGGA